MLPPGGLHTSSASRWVIAAAIAGLMSWLQRTLASMASGFAVDPAVATARFGYEAQRALCLLALGWLLRLAARASGSAAGERQRLRMMVSVSAAVASFALAEQLSRGAWVAAQSWVGLFPACSGVLGGAVGAFAAPVLQRAHALSLQVAALLLGLGAAAHAIDLRVLPGLYPWAHFALACGGTATTLLGVGALVGRTRAGTSLPGLAAAIAVLGVGLNAWFTMDAETQRRMFTGADASSLVVPVAPVQRANLLQAELERMLHDNAAVPRPVPPSARRPASQGPPNVVLLGVDTLRADALPPARGSASQIQTPFLDEWLQRAVRFRRAYVSSTSTRKSIPSLLYSAESHRHIGEHHVSLTAQLAAHGYETAAVLPSWFTIDDQESPARHAMMRDFGQVKHYLQDRPDTIVDAVEALALGQRAAPFFLWVHYMVLHDPRLSGPGEHAPDGQAGYAPALAYLDRELGALHQSLRNLGVIERTVVVLFSDHGEAFGEHGVTFHGLTVFEEEAHVPLAMWLPGEAGKLVEQVVSNLDIAPTISALVGAAPAEGWHGWDLTPWLADDGRGPPEVDRELLIENRSARQLGVVRGSRKLIYDENFGTLSEYDLASDPGERRARTPQQDPVGRQMTRTIFASRPYLTERHGRRPETMKLVLQHLDQGLPGVADDRLAFVLGIAGATDSPEVTQRARHLFETSSDEATRLMILEQFHARHPALVQSLLSRWLADSPDDVRPRLEAEFARLQQSILMPVAPIP